MSLREHYVFLTLLSNTLYTYFILLAIVIRTMDSKFVSNAISNDDHNDSLGRTLHDTQLRRKNGEILSATAIAELKDTVSCNIVVRGQASADEYRAAIDRWNHNGIKEAVRHTSLRSAETVILICVLGNCCLL